MILKRVVKEFMNRPRDDLRLWKHLEDDELWDKWERLDHKPPIWKKLRKHQKVCFLLGEHYKKLAMFLDTGSGKTLLSIALARYFERSQLSGRNLVLVPNRINVSEWRREVKKHSPATSIELLEGPTEEKWKQLEEGDALLNVITYTGLLHMVCDLVPQKKKGKLTGKNKMQPSVPKINRMMKIIKGAYLDESSLVGNIHSLFFRVSRQISKRANVFIELTGTPFGRDPLPVWSQMFLVDDGYSLGETLGLFRAAFYDSDENYWGGHEHTFKKKMRPVLHTFLAHRSIRYEADQADLPKVSRITKEVPSPLDSKNYREKLDAVLKASKGNYQEVKNAFIHMRQLSSGFIGLKDDDTGDRMQFEFEDKPKLEALLDLVVSIREGYKIIVCYDFIKSGNIISAALKEEKIKHVLISGKTKDPEARTEKFINDPDTNVLVMNVVGAYGLNLQMARYMIFYESPVPIIQRKQMERRIERQYSKYERIFIYDLVTRGTYDQQILDFHEEGKDLFKAVVDGSFTGFTH